MKFAIEYVGKYKQKENSKNNLDIDVEAIDTSELLESEQRLGKIVDYVIAHHARKTHNRNFTAMMCVGSIPSLLNITRYSKKKEAGEHKLKIGTSFPTESTRRTRTRTAAICSKSRIHDEDE